MNDKLYISEELVHLVLEKLDEIKSQAGQRIRMDYEMLSSVLRQFGWNAPAICE